MKKILLLVLTSILILTFGCAGARALKRAERHAERGEWDMAVKEYREANRQNPGVIEYRSALLRAEETAANRHYRQARNFMKERRLDQAVDELQKALYLNPSNAAIQSALKSVLDMKQAEEHYRAALTLMDRNLQHEAIVELHHSIDLDPGNGKYLDAIEQLRIKEDEVEPEGALALASDKPITLNFKNTNIKQVFERLSRLSGVNILFDEEVRPRPVTVFVKDLPFRQTLDLLLSTNKLFMKNIGVDSIIIVPKTMAKTRQYQDLVMKTFYLSNVKAKDIINLLHFILDTRRVFVNATLNSISVRDTPEKIKLVEKIIAANDLEEAEVILDVEILELSRSSTLRYGWNFSPGGLSAGASLQDAGTAAGAGIPLSRLRDVSNDNVILTLPGVALNLIKQDAEAQTLANPRVRVLSNNKARFHIGDRIPVQTSTVQASAANAVTSTFEYKDVGIKLNIEPTVHLNNTVTLKLGLEISTLGDALEFGGGQKQFRFGTRNTDTTISLRDGETVIIGGLIKDEERKSRNKVPLLGDIPILGKLFSSSDDGAIASDILMSITPNIVRNLELPDKELQAFWSGTGETFDVKPLFVTTTSKTP